MLSWRDTKNPKGGGAEYVTYELFRRWAKEHECTWFTSAFDGCLSSEVIDGVKVIRKGGAVGVYFEAYKFLKRNKFDVVIDQVNTIPFFTPLYYSGKKIAFFHQLCENIWFYEMKFPLSLIGYIAEKIYLRLYNRIPSFAVSESTKKNLQKHGFKEVFVMKDCIDSKPLDSVPSKDRNSLVYVGRLKKSKRVHDIIEAFSIVHKEIPSSKLHIVGRGDKGYERKLKKMARLKENIIFHGYLPKEKRNSLMSKSEAILVASVKEGWGLIVVEAAAVGTPAIVYDVDGLRDSVKDGETGLITKENNPEELAKSIIGFLKDDKLKKDLSLNALEYSRSFDWDESAGVVLSFLSSY